MTALPAGLALAQFVLTLQPTTRNARSRIALLLILSTGRLAQTKRAVLVIAGLVLLFGCASLGDAQVSAPANPDNILTPTSPIGTPPGVVTDGTNESVNLSNGALTVYIPLISVPQRGGWSLPLAYIHSSNHNYLTQSVSTQAEELPEAYWQNVFTFTDSMAYPSDALFEINLPRLQASQEYAGDYSFSSSLDGDLQQTGLMGRYCITNFVFTDWQGNKHPFAITLVCNQPIGADAPFEASTVGDATDGSFYRIDLSNTSYYQVISKDGTVFQFPSYAGNPYGPPPGSSPCCASGQSIENWYDSRFTLMRDTNGNTISLTNTSGGNFLVTDTLGRQFTISSTGITYTGSNGKSQSISLNLTNNTSAPYPFSVTCTPNVVSGGGHPPPQASCNVVNVTPYSYYANASITYPSADVNGDQRTIGFELDSRNRITKISYPTGGYTRYDYLTASVDSWSTLTDTAYPMSEVSHRYECPSSTGQCATENTTTYAPTPAQDYAGTRPFNSSMQVTDPIGNIAIHNFYPVGPQQLSPKEISQYRYDANNKLYWSQTTSYVTLGSPLVATDLYFPNTISTTLNDGTSPITSTVTYNYDTYPAQIAPISADPQTTTMYDDNPTQITETDFGGTTKRITTESWNPLGFFSGSSGHILDRLSSKTITDQVKGLTNGTTYIYDNGSNTVGNLTSKTISATNAPTAVTQYVVNSYGQVTSTTDPDKNTTQFGYTDAWADSSCAPPPSSAYPTSVKDALNETTSYTYNSCTGTIASVTGPNPGQTTSYTYDALQRVVSVTYPDTGGKEACYFDSAPNTVTTYTLQAVGTALPSCTTVTATPAGSLAQSVILDGVGRKSQTTLLSDPDGPTSTNTAYDADGNVQSVSIPFRSLANSGYTTSYEYDALNRKRFAYNPDSTSQGSSSFEEWSYAGNVTTFTDENGNNWQRTTDVMGNLTQVLEPSGSSTTPVLETDYSYDGFNNLWSVTQWGGPINSAGYRSRSFVYDGMSRLRSATNPESGTTTYIYDANGNLTFKTVPAPNTAAASALTLTTNYAYDLLNRITSKTYTNDAYQSPWTCFQYGLPSTAVSGANQIGRLMNEWTQRYSAGACASTMPASGFLTAREIAVYDLIGRVKQEKQCTPSNCSSTSPFSLSNTYDLAGNLITYTNGISSTPGANSEPLTFTQGFGGAGRLQSVTSSWSDSQHPSSMFSAQSGSSPAYVPQGALANATFGNVLTLSRTYDTRLRITGEALTGNTVLSATPGTATVTIQGSEQSK